MSVSKWTLLVTLLICRISWSICASHSRSHENQLDDEEKFVNNKENELIPVTNQSFFDVEASGQPDDNLQNSTNDDMNNWPYFQLGCTRWLPLNHLYFHLANTFLFLSYFATGGIYGLVYLRATLAIGCAFFAIWGWIILCAFDTFLWNAFFFVINLFHGIYVVFTLRPVRFDKQVEEVYKCMFQPLKISKQQFRKVVDCMKSFRPLKNGEYFATEKQTRVETLSLLLSGRMVVSQNGKPLHYLNAMQFVDSPEWFGVAPDDYFQVSIRAVEESRVLLWHRDKLKLTLLSDSFLQAVFDHILGRDVVRKLTQMKEAFTDNGFIKDVNESCKLSSPSKTVHEHGLNVAPEQILLLDEDGAKIKGLRDAKNKTSPLVPITSRQNRYDYSNMERLGSTDI